MTPLVHVRLVDPVELVLSRINSRMRGGLLEVRIDCTGVDPAVREPLERTSADALGGLMPLLEPGQTPIVRYYVERNVPDLVQFDVAADQADVYLERGLMPRDLVDELAGHSTNLLRKFAL